jgi:hypothetical protein
VRCSNPKIKDDIVRRTLFEEVISLSLVGLQEDSDHTSQRMPGVIP